MFKEDDGEGISTVFEDLDINDELLTIEEVEKATSIFVEGKASGSTKKERLKTGKLTLQISTS